MNEEPSLEELKSFFENMRDTLPKSIQLGPGVKITDVAKSIESSFAVLEFNRNNPTYNCFKEDLIKLKSLLSGAA